MKSKFKSYVCSYRELIPSDWGRARLPVLKLCIFFAPTTKSIRKSQQHNQRVLLVPPCFHPLWSHRSQQELELHFNFLDSQSDHVALIQRFQLSLDEEIHVWLVFIRLHIDIPLNKWVKGENGDLWLNGCIMHNITK